MAAGKTIKTREELRPPILRPEGGQSLTAAQRLETGVRMWRCRQRAHESGRPVGLFGGVGPHFPNEVVRRLLPGLPATNEPQPQKTRQVPFGWSPSHYGRIAIKKETKEPSVQDMCLSCLRRPTSEKGRRCIHRRRAFFQNKHSFYFRGKKSRSL